MNKILVYITILVMFPTLAISQQSHSTENASVGAWRLEAEDYAADGTGIRTDSNASGGKAVSCNALTQLEGIPFPRTSRANTIYVRIKPGSGKESYRLYTTLPGQKQIIASVSPAKFGAWQWLRFSNIYSSEVGDTFNLEYSPNASGAVNAKIDSIVVSTNNKLTNSELDNVSLLFPGRPFAIAAKCSQPPIIDGKGTDLCWENTVVCTDFLLKNTETKAAGQTTVRFCYDNKNLYALFTCSEPILDPVVQRLHEFSAKVKDRDGDVMQDDCVAMIIRPNAASKDAYDFFVNALGTINDAHCLTSDLWGSRDTKWNMNAQASGSIDNGKWSLEIAMPFADLSKKQPKVGDDWQICIGRAALARNEISSWNPSFTGLHNPKEMGIIRFGGISCGTELHMPDKLEPGKNTISLVLSDSKNNTKGVYVVTSIAGQSGIKHSYHLAVPGETNASDFDFQVQETGEMTVAYGVLDAATCQPLYLTPALNRSVTGFLSTVAIKCDNPYELYLNGDSVAKGQTANGEPIKVSLRKGVNVFAVKLDGGTAAIKISAPGIDGSNQSWKIAPSDATDPFNPDIDDSTWRTASVNAKSFIGEAGKPVVIRHTLLLEKTRIWPAPLPAWHICKGATQQLLVNIGPIEHRKLTEWSLYVAVPKGFKITGCTGYGDTHKMTSVGERKIDGRNMTVYKTVPIKMAAALPYDLSSGVLLFIRCNVNMKSDKTSFLYWISANSGTISELRHSIPIRILPALNGVQPKKLTWMLCGMYSEMTNPAMRDEVAKTARSAGFNNLLTESVDMRHILDKYGISNTSYLSFDGVYNRGIPKFHAYLKDHPDECLIGIDGTPSARYLCTTLAIDNSDGALTDVIKLHINDCQMGNIFYDFEFSPFNGPHSCFCARCLNTFKKYAGLSVDPDLNGATIKDKYAAKWIDFTAYRNAEVLLRIKNILHSLAPQMKLWVYSGYQSDDNAASYGINWDYVGKLKSCDVAGMGYGRPVPNIATTLTDLRGIPAVFGCLLIPYTASDYSPSTQVSKARMLRRLLDSTGGVLFWQRDSMDGRTWYASAETSRLVATYETVFLKGKRSALPGQDESALQMLTDGKNRLLCIMNETNQQAEYNIRMPGTKGRWKEFYTGQVIKSGETLKTKLLPGEISVYVQVK